MPYMFIILAVTGAFSSLSGAEILPKAAVISSGVSFVLSLVGISVWIQSIVYILLFTMLFTLIRIARSLRVRKRQRSEAIVIETIDNRQRSGRVIVGGRVYRAVNRDFEKITKAGAVVVPRGFIKGICVC